MQVVLCARKKIALCAGRKEREKQLLLSFYCLQVSQPMTPPFFSPRGGEKKIQFGPNYSHSFPFFWLFNRTVRGGMKNNLCAARAREKKEWDWTRCVGWVVVNSTTTEHTSESHFCPLSKVLEGGGLSRGRRRRQINNIPPSFPESLLASAPFHFFPETVRETGNGKE